MIRLFRVFVPASVAALLLSETILLFACYIGSCFWLYQDDANIFLLYDGGLLRITLVVFTILLGMHFSDLYTEIRPPSGLLLMQQMMVVIGIAFISQALVSYVSRDWMSPRWVMIYGSSAAVVTITLWRMFYARFVLGSFGGVKLLFVGNNQLVQEIAGRLKAKPELGLQPVGYLSEEGAQPGPEDPLECLGPIPELRSVADKIQPNRIIVGLTERRQRLPVQDLLDLRFSGVRIEEAATMYEWAFGQVCVREIRPSALIYSAELGPSSNLLMLQTLYSSVLAVVLGVLALPVFVIIALLVRITSPGPVLYRQQRVGRNGRVFMLYKFRSMVVDAEAKSGAVWAGKNDPRVTPIGRVLRKYRFDELPQLINVIKGDMSLVGPRPERPEFVTQLSEQIPYYRQRHCIKPGLTGWAQISYKYGDTMADVIAKLQYDLYYIKHLSPALDAYILFHTAKTVLLRRGAQ
jgi:sugar transferase (PEP-CTERM system associated)